MLLWQGWQINSGLPQRQTWTYRHSKKSLHPLCATKLVCPFTGRCSAGYVAYPRTPKASDTPSGCLEFREQHECYPHRAPMPQAVQHRFSTQLCQCLSLYSSDLQAPPFKVKCLHTFPILCCNVQKQWQSPKAVTLPGKPLKFWKCCIFENLFIIHISGTIFYFKIKSQPNQRVLSCVLSQALQQTASIALLIFTCSPFAQAVV